MSSSVVSFVKRSGNVARDPRVVLPGE
jgi:hypothetical protein